MRDDTLAILADLIALPTVSADPNLELVAYVADRLSRCGASVSIFRDETGHKANLFATIGPEVDGGVVLSGHTDVVPADPSEWAGDPFAMRLDGDRLYGRGACDMKGFIAAALAMAPQFARGARRRPIHFAFTYDEEVGCLGGRELVRSLGELPYRPAMAIVGEPTSMRVIEGHKGCYEYTTTFTGRDGHGSDPDQGVNAIEYAVRYISRLMDLGDALRRAPPPSSRFVPPWTTVQVGRIDGGAARNVIASHCAVDWEMRPVTKRDADHVKASLAAYCAQELLPAMRRVAPEADIATTVIGEVDGLEPMDDNSARDLVAALTGANSADLVAFGTEAGLFQDLGLSVIVCGPGDIAQAHKPDEYVTVNQLDACLAMLDKLDAKTRETDS
jgi:acetylornithine deacetylase